MVSYGEWTQDVDFHVFSTVDTNDTDDYVQQIGTSSEATPFQDPVYPITVQDMNNTFSAAQALVDYEGAWVEFFHSGYDLSFPNWSSKWDARIWSRRIHIGGRENLYNPPNYGFSAPEGAIGIDYANRPYDVADPWGSAVGDVQTFHLGAQSFYEGQFEDGRVANGQPLPYSVSSTLYIEVAGQSPVPLDEIASPANDTAGNWVTVNFDEAIDMAPFGATASDNWTADVFTVTSSPVIGGDPAPYVSTLTRYGWLVQSIRLNRWVRPPLYRWVYATEPYRRVFPRDDALAGGAGRNYPPSRAMQSGNRTSGGYW